MGAKLQHVRFASIGSLINSVFNFAVSVFAALVICRSGLRDRKASMRMVRNLWLVLIVTDLVAPIPVILTLRNLHEEQFKENDPPQKLAILVIQLIFAIVFFSYVWALDAV